jgi:hypothetical protein
MIMSLLTIVIYVVILGLLYWLCDYLLGLFPLPEPMNRIVRAIVIILLVLILISILLSILGSGPEIGLPRFR